MQKLLITQPASNRGRNYWQKIVEIFEHGNEPAKDFCARMNIKLGTLSHWRGIFKKEKIKLSNKFIEVKLTKDEKFFSKFTIKCPNGYKIIMDSEVTFDEAQSMFKLLGLIP